MKKLAIAVALSLSAFAGNALADREFADIYTECGLGAMIAPNNAVVAAVTNVTWDLGTTAISSELSSPDMCKGTPARTAAFIYESYLQLENDLAQGSGEYMAALLNLAGCSIEGQISVTEGLRGELAKAVAQPGYSNQTRFEQSQAMHGQLHQFSDKTCSSI